MAKLLKRLVLSILTLCVVGLVFGWLVLAAPFFSEFRRGLVSQLLTDALNQETTVNGDVSVVIGPVLKIHASGVIIPSESMPDVHLAELNLLELDIDLFELLDRSVDLDNLKVDGLHVNMIRAPDGKTSWTVRQGDDRDDSDDKQTEDTDTTTAAPATDTPPKNQNGILSFLADRTAALSDIGLLMEDQTSGFVFDFQLSKLNFAQMDQGARLQVTSTGSVNGQTFELLGNYPHAAAFTTQANFGEMTVAFNGAPIPRASGGGYNAHLSLDTGQLGDLLEVFGLERVLDGTGSIEADITSQKSLLRIENFDSVMTLDKGQELTLAGGIENMLSAQGIDLKFNARLHPEGAPPAKADELADLKLTGLKFRVKSAEQKIKFNKFLITTNAFDQGLDEVGPISIGGIRRTPEGNLAFKQIRLQAGPRDLPYVTAEGDILNVLQLKDLQFSGGLYAPADLVLDQLNAEIADDFGAVEAEFEINDRQGVLSLSKLDARTVGTDIWGLQMRVAVGNIKEIDGLEFDFDLDIANGADFLQALQLEPVDTGALELRASARGEGKNFSTTLGLTARGSAIDGSLSTTVTDGRPQVNGRIHSARIDIEDVSDAVEAIVQLGNLSSGEPGTDADAETEEVEIQPLVLPEDEGSPTDMFNPKELILQTDLSVEIEIEEITGQKGVSSLSSALTAKDGKAVLGPVEVTYGGGFFKLGAEMDLIETPDSFTVSGATGGWDFGEILDAVGLGIDAHGILYGDFNVTGSSASFQSFARTMSGYAQISMNQGQIATSILELAGLGIFPWLFSEELHQGYTDITCVRAPVRISPGRVTFDAVVAETASVQLVAGGDVDWIGKTIALRAEPRRVGRPLSRSAWPFDVTGSLNAPKFKLDVGGSFANRRQDGADEMPADRKPCTPDILQLE